VNRPWFRVLHGAAIATVVLQSWLGITCPLTDLEWWLRAQAGEVLPARGFIELWLHRLLFFQAPGWVFALAYPGCFTSPLLDGHSRLFCRSWRLKRLAVRPLMLARLGVGSLWA
jgi:hypothetical protein